MMYISLFLLLVVVNKEGAGSLVLRTTLRTNHMQPICHIYGNFYCCWLVGGTRGSQILGVLVCLSLLSAFHRGMIWLIVMHGQCLLLLTGSLWAVGWGLQHDSGYET
jgi:hypothetical protein